MHSIVRHLLSKSLGEVKGMVAKKKARTILCLGPPHSGKSIFCYILFKFLRELGDDACVMDADYYSPTYRRIRIHELASPDEYDHIITTPNATKLEELTEENFHRLCQSIHDMIEHKGAILVDGVGRHTLSTESLLQLAEMLVVLCPSQFRVERDSEKCSYIRNGKEVHPFIFYLHRMGKYITIRTHYQNEKRAYFDENELEGELYDLDRKAIGKGNIDKIPEATRLTVNQIAEFILSNWL